MHTKGVFATNTYNGRMGTLRRPIIPCFTSAACSNVHTLVFVPPAIFNSHIYIFSVLETASVSSQLGSN